MTVLLAVGGCAGVGAAGTPVVAREDIATTPVVLVRHDPADDEVARQVRRALRYALPVAERWGALSSTVTITIHPTHEALEAAARRPGHAWLRAWARPAAIELQSPRTWSQGEATDAELEQLLAHELTHCAMFQAIGDARVARTIPVWFREGLATTSAGEYHDAAAATRTAALAGGALAYRTDAAAVYAAADQAFRELLRRHGEASIRRLLARMGEGHDFASAFRDATGVTLDAFEDDLARALRQDGTHG